MKKLLCVLAVFTAVMVAVAGAAQAKTYRVKGKCKGDLAGYGWFEADTDLEVEFADGDIDREYRYFYFYGFLDDVDSKSPRVTWDDQHVVYREGHYDVAVPYISGAGLWFKDNTKKNRWTKLCDY
ncbi:hypothetical protein [Nocardia xishanensis]|uniref:hypothetical protein n=1 Tax=Nocardia xishanensis TaxID=238964 RepID=UPI00082DF186|nr:hypothetical protein [Nocardia xishanensis]